MNRYSLRTYISSFLVFLVLVGLAFVGFFAALFIIPIVLAVGAFFIWRTKRKMKEMFANNGEQFVYVYKQNNNNDNIIEINEKDYTVIDVESQESKKN